MKAIYIHRAERSIGTLLLGVFNDQLCLMDYLTRSTREAVDHRLKSGLRAEFVQKIHPLALSALEEVDEYLSGKRQHFDIPLLTVGTPFQKLVWETLQHIPYGETISYAQLAERTGRPAAVRAVASVNAANALSLFIPCHRVIRSNGDVGGYAGGSDAKKELLRLEYS